MRTFAIALLAATLCGSTPAALAQGGIPPGAALPSAPFWWPIGPDERLGILPLAWYNDIDGPLFGAALRQHDELFTLWAGAAVGLDGDGGAPAALEAAVRADEGGLSFRRLHGRNALTVGWRPTWTVHGYEPGLGAVAMWLDDDGYLETLPFFECPTASDAAPCNRLEIPYAWSGGRDHALEMHVRKGSGTVSAPGITATVTLGSRILGGDTDYARIETLFQVSGPVRELSWNARVATGWVSHGAPRQRRFRLDGADPITRWLNPLLEARGALLEEIPHFVPGGPHVRAYEETRPLVKRYVAVAGGLSDTLFQQRDLFGEAGLFAEAAWTPALPDLLGPDDIRPGGDFLLDWRQLPEGEGAALGRFRARQLALPEIWADAGVSFTAGFRALYLTVSLPLWVSEPAFAAEPTLDNEKKAFALRWALTLGVDTSPGPD